MRLLLFVLISLFLISACSPTSLELISQKSCSESGGHWNECGSPCAGTGSDFCIESCEEMCECGGIAGFNCPNGYTCLLSGKIADEMGKCILN